jgi:hypothetical protein
MPQTRWLTLAGIAALTAVASCSLSTDLPTTHLIGVLNLEAVPFQDTGYVTSPTAIFFDQVTSNITLQLPDSRFVVDSCRSASIPTDTGSASGLEHVDAGPSVSFDYPDGTLALTPDTALSGFITYEALGHPPLHIAPGSQITLTVPGAQNGFPPSTITATTVTAYDFGPVDTIPSDSLVVTWTSPMGSTAAMVVELKYASSPQHTFADKEIFCSWIDDGQGVVPATLAAAWRTAQPGSRFIDSYRWQTTINNGQNSGLIVISQLDRHKLSFP